MAAFTQKRHSGSKTWEEGRCIIRSYCKLVIPGQDFNSPLHFRKNAQDRLDGESSSLSDMALNSPTSFRFHSKYPCCFTSFKFYACRNTRD